MPVVVAKSPKAEVFLSTKPSRVDRICTLNANKRIYSRFADDQIVEIYLYQWDTKNYNLDTETPSYIKNMGTPSIIKMLEGRNNNEEFAGSFPYATIQHKKIRQLT